MKEIKKRSEAKRGGGRNTGREGVMEGGSNGEREGGRKRVGKKEK